MRIALAIAATWLVTALTAAPQTLPPAVEFHPPPAPVQPIAYSHSTHVALGLTCVTCHAGATAGPRATIPAASACLTCHATVKAESPDIQKLAAYGAGPEAVPWVRVYRVPDFVYFDHARHLNAAVDITCDTCHGAVERMTIVQKVKDTSMAACVACHTQRGAATRCDTCHEERG